MKRIIAKQLAQARPSTNEAESIFKTSEMAYTTITSIVITNTSTLPASFSIFLDDDGVIYDESTALFWEVEVNPSTTFLVDTNWNMNNANGNLAAKSSIASAFTFTIFGSQLT